jgi:putative ATP-dependent endonuclease of the OLD family
MVIRSLTIRRFRGIESLSWRPGPGINCLVGPGDAGKTTVLEAVALLLYPRRPPLISEYHYFRRHLADGFEIETVLGGLTDAVTGSMRIAPLRGWLNGGLQALPDEGGAEPVLVARLVGSPTLELSYELLPPSGEPVPFTTAMRQQLLLAELGADERGTRELRLSQGSLLERHLSGIDFRRPLTAAIGTASARLELPDEAQRAIARISESFRIDGLPSTLRLGLLAPQGFPLVGLLSLFSGTDPAEAVPLAVSGSGTRQLAVFRLALSLVEGTPILVFDEPESGLEPYRQRAVIAELRRVITPGGQAFLTTHSPTILESLQPAELWLLRPGENPTCLGSGPIGDVVIRAPDALLSRLPVICEGNTEAGFLGPLLDHRAVQDRLGSIDLLGIRLIAGTGQPRVIEEADALLAAGIACGLFADAEDAHRGRRERVAANDRCAYGTWYGVRNIEEAVATWLPFEQLAEIIAVAAEQLGRSTNSVLQQVAERCAQPGAHDLAWLRGAAGEDRVRQALTRAMGENKWFKDTERATSLAVKLLKLGLPPEIDATIARFWAEIRRVLGT